jgi:hypothetical protein
MQWDMGLQGVVVMAGIALAFGVLAALLVGGGLTRRAWAAVITTVACFGAGLLTSEWLFGWATEEELQPNVDGLSRDEVLLSSFLVTVAVVVGLRLAARRARRRDELEGASGGAAAAHGDRPVAGAGAPGGR